MTDDMLHIYTCIDLVTLFFLQNVRLMKATTLSGLLTFLKYSLHGLGIDMYLSKELIYDIFLARIFSELVLNWALNEEIMD